MFDVEFPALATVLSGFLAFVLGIFWYHPRIMGKRWAAIRGIDTENMKSDMRPFVISFTLWMLTAAFYSFLVTMLGITAADGFGTLSAFFCVSCLLWVAFSMPPIVMGALYTGHSFEAVSIDASYHLAGYYVFALVHALAGYLPL